MTEFGPPIPHAPGKPCPFPNAVGLVYFSDLERWQIGYPMRLGSWRDTEYSSGNITHYRLPADHHAYGPRVSRMGGEPDETYLIWENGTRLKIGVTGGRKSNHYVGDHKIPRIGIWRIYLKDKV